jgi:acetyl esterase/lipase
VTFPAFEEDGANAVYWVQAHAREFGGDSHRMVLMGHSAGAHTAAFLAFNHAFTEGFGVKHRNIVGLVGLSGPYRLVPDSAELHAEFPAPYTEADWQPIRFVDSEAPPTLLMHGLDDEDVSPSQSIELHDALLAAHVRVEMDLFAHRKHADTVASFAWVLRWRTPVVKAVDVFIRSVTERPKP